MQENLNLKELDLQLQ